MLELISVPAVIAAAESVAAPAIATLIASEVLPFVKQTKHNSILSVLFAVVKAVARELAAPAASPVEPKHGVDPDVLNKMVEARVKEALEADKTVATFEVDKPCSRKPAKRNSRGQFVK